MNRSEMLDDAEEAQLQALEGLQAKMWTALPGIVVSADLAAQTCVVQPTIKGVLLDKKNNATSVNLPLLADVPICFPRAGQFALTLPLSAGDEVLVVFSSRAIDSWWQSGGVGEPVEQRMHDLSDGLAILAPTSQPKKLTAVQSDGMELRTLDRNVFIKLTTAGIQIKGNITHEGDVAQTGNQTQVGNLTQTGNIANTGTLLNNGKDIGNAHKHSGVTSGGSNTGNPI